MYSGRPTQKPIESNLVALNAALKTATAGVASGEPVNEQILSDSAADKSEQLGKLVEQDRSGTEMLYFQSELSRAQAGAPARGVVVEDGDAKESGQAEATVLGDVPALGRMFKKQSESEMAARELSVVQQEQSDDIKALSERSRSSGESARQSLSRAKEGKDVLAELPAKEYESLNGGHRRNHADARGRQVSSGLRRRTTTRVAIVRRHGNRSLPLRPTGSCCGARVKWPATKSYQRPRPNRRVTESVVFGLNEAKQEGTTTG